MTLSFIKGFCSVRPSYAITELILPIVELLIFAMYINRRNIIARLKHILADNIGWVAFICSTLILVCITYFADIRLNENNNSTNETAVWKCVVDFAQGVLGTLTGIWVVYIILRPKLKIYSVMAIQDDENKQPYGIVLVKNTNWTDLMDVEFFMQCCWTEEDGNISVVNFVTDPPNSPVLRNKLYTNECTCAWHISLTPEDKQLGSFEDFVNMADYVRCRVIATHSLSGIRFLTEYKFSATECKRGIYDSNNNFKQQ